MTNCNLRDKKHGIDQECEAVSVGAYDLGNVIYQQMGDLPKAEKLIREALRIKMLIFGSNHHNIGPCCNLLANILLEQLKFGDETRILFERALAISIRHVRTYVHASILSHVLFF
jgi:tetratricopeptide (TPR) repeat protein